MYACPLGTLKGNAGGSVAMDPNGWQGAERESKPPPALPLGFGYRAGVMLLEVGLVDRNCHELRLT